MSTSDSGNTDAGSNEIPGIDTTVPPSGTGSAECLATSDGWWVHLRRCAQCGHVGCCDSSPSQHATKHFHATSHPFMQSFEPGEDWFFDFRDESMAYGPELAAPTSHPEDQVAPAPRDRVPANWRDLIH